MPTSVSPPGYRRKVPMDPPHPPELKLQVPESHPVWMLGTE